MWKDIPQWLERSIVQTHLCGNFKLLDNSELKEHADARLDEAELRYGEIAEGKRVQILPVYVVCFGDVGFLDQKQEFSLTMDRDFLQLLILSARTSSLYISFWSQSSGSASNFSLVFWWRKEPS